jgi:replicative DNA helicase
MPAPNGSKPTSEAVRPDRLAPYSAEAEQAVLGSVLIDPESYYQVSHFLRPGQFFITRHEMIWTAIQAVIERGDNLDYVSLVDQLRTTGQLDEIGGPAYLTQLMAHTPPSLFVETYAHLVERAAVRRGLIDAAGKIAALGGNEEKDVPVILDEAEAALAAVTADRQVDSTASMKQTANEMLDELDIAGEHPGIPTGFADLDQLLGGLQKSDLLIVASRPGMGKTAWLLTVALHAARHNQRVMIFSLEMDRIQLMRRWLAMETGITTEKQRSGKLTGEEREQLVEATMRFSQLFIWIDDSAALTPPQLEAKARRAYNEHGLDLVIVDYVQLMTAQVGRDANRVQEVSAITRSLKQLARALHVPVLAAAQVSRAVEQRGNKRPMLSDLRESGSLEQDADVVMFLYRDEVYNEQTTTPNECECIVAKHRNGPTGTIGLYFLKERTQFGNLHRGQQLDLEPGYGRSRRDRDE